MDVEYTATNINTTSYIKEMVTNPLIELACNHAYSIFTTIKVVHFLQNLQCALGKEDVGENSMRAVRRGVRT